MIVCESKPGIRQVSRKTYIPYIQLLSVALFIRWKFMNENGCNHSQELGFLLPMTSEFVAMTYMKHIFGFINYHTINLPVSGKIPVSSSIRYPVKFYRIFTR